MTPAKMSSGIKVDGLAPNTDPFTGEDDEAKKDYIARKIQLETATKMTAELKASLHPQCSMHEQVKEFEAQIAVLREEFEWLKWSRECYCIQCYCLRVADQDIGANDAQQMRD